MTTISTQIIAPFAVAFLVSKLLSWRRNAASLPPGPPKLPFIDNLHNMPSGFDWIKFDELAKQYNSDIIHLSALGQSIVILNSFAAAKDLLENRSGIYSSRPSSVMMTELAHMSVVSLMPYGDAFRTCRRMFAKHLGPENAKVNRPRELFYTRRCLGQLLETPDNFHRHLQHLVGSISLSITYGLKARTENDEYIDMSQGLVEILTEIATAGAFMVDVIPALKYVPAWFPGAGFQRLASRCSQSMKKARESLFKVAMDTMETKDYTPSMVSEILEELGTAATDVDLELVKDVALTIYAAAADTTWAALTVFIQAMVSYPEVQKKLQDELDAVISGKLPEYDDVKELPYLKAVFMEVIRWKPITPFGIPHVSTMSDNYRGYVIPDGSVVIANQWSILQDPAIYPDPTEFKPERFLKEGKIDELIQNPLDIGFGFGRRICPGRHIAQSTFMLVAASILSTFDLLMKKDMHGNPIRPDPEYHLSLICHPKDFPCLIVPRSLESRQLIDDWAAAEGDSPP